MGGLWVALHALEAARSHAGEKDRCIPHEARTARTLGWAAMPSGCGSECGFGGGGTECTFLEMNTENDVVHCGECTTDFCNAAAGLHAGASAAAARCGHRCGQLVLARRNGGMTRAATANYRQGA